MRRAKKLVLVPAFFLWLLALLCLVPVRVQAQPAALTAADSAPAQGGFDVQIQAPPDIQALLQQHMELMRYRALTDIDDGELARLARAAQQDVQGARDPNAPASWGRVGRNEDCPCGSGRKFKHCHGTLV